VTAPNDDTQREATTVRHVSRVAAMVIVGVLAALAVVGATTPATAGDQSISLSFESDTTEVEPGERVELHVIADTDGGSGGEGVQNSTLRLIYPGEYLDVVAVEPGGFMQGSSASLEVDRRVNNSVGVLEFDQNLPDARDGVTGTDYLAHVTVEVAADAPPRTLEVAVHQPYFELAVTGSPLAYRTQSTDIAVSGGGERVEPTMPDTVAFGPLPADGSVADDGGENRTDGKNANADGGGAGFGLVAGFVAVLAVALYLRPNVS
jgi:hypothetical protein